MYCYKCGKEINNESHFCKFCGTEQAGHSELNKDKNIANNSNKSYWEKIVSSTGFRIYIILVGIWSILWYTDLLDLYNDDYVVITIIFFFIIPLILHWWGIKWIKEKIKNRQQN